MRASMSRAMRGAAYRLFDAADPAPGLRPAERAVWDTLAVPEEHV